MQLTEHSGEETCLETSSIQLQPEIFWNSYRNEETNEALKFQYPIEKRDIKIKPYISSVSLQTYITRM